jgi:hypothetical protein
MRPSAASGRIRASFLPQIGTTRYLQHRDVHASTLGTRPYAVIALIFLESGFQRNFEGARFATVFEEGQQMPANRPRSCLNTLRGNSSCVCLHVVIQIFLELSFNFTMA